MEKWNDGKVVFKRTLSIFNSIVKTIIAINPAAQYPKTHYSAKDSLRAQYFSSGAYALRAGGQLGRSPLMFEIIILFISIMTLSWNQLKKTRSQFETRVFLFCGRSFLGPERQQRLQGIVTPGMDISNRYSENIHMHFMYGDDESLLEHITEYGGKAWYRAF